MYRIGEFSKINKVTVKTLRYYDEAGLVKPARIDPETGYRYYTTGQLPLLHRVIALKQLGLAINEIAGILDGDDARPVMKQRIARLEEMLRTNTEQLARLKQYTAELRGDKAMNYEAAIKELPGVTVFSRRFTIKSYDDYFTEVPEIGRRIKEANPGLECREPAYCFTIYHDNEYRDTDIDVEVCEAVTRTGEPVDDIVFKDIPAVPTAVCVFHKGPYSTLRKAYGFLFKWIEDNGYTMAAPPRESYIDGIWNKENDAEWLTEVQVPVTKNGS